MRPNATGATPTPDEHSEVAELGFLLNGGPASARSDRAKAQEQAKQVMPPPTANELRVMSVQAAVDALVEHVAIGKVVVGCCERWQALGYGPGRRQSAADAGALPAIVAGMRAHPASALVQEKCCLAIANICSGTDEAGLARKSAAFDAGAVPAIVAALEAHGGGKSGVGGSATVVANGSAAIGNICYAADNSALARKHAAYEAGAIEPIARALSAFASDAAVCENGAFALGNLCRALGRVGNASTGDFAAPELAPIDEQLKQREQGAVRKQTAADAGALEALVSAIKAHGESNKGVQDWGSRALSIITYENTTLRERAKKAGAKMTWLMGLTESMDAAQSAQKAAAAGVSKTGRTPVVPASGRPNSRPPPGTVRGY